MGKTYRDYFDLLENAVLQGDEDLIDNALIELSISSDVLSMSHAEYSNTVFPFLCKMLREFENSEKYGGSILFNEILSNLDKTDDLVFENFKKYIANSYGLYIENSVSFLLAEWIGGFCDKWTLNVIDKWINDEIHMIPLENLSTAINEMKVGLSTNQFENGEELMNSCVLLGDKLKKNIASRK